MRQKHSTQWFCLGFLNQLDYKKKNHQEISLKKILPNSINRKWKEEKQRYLIFYNNEITTDMKRNKTRRSQ